MTLALILMFLFIGLPAIVTFLIVRAIGKKADNYITNKIKQTQRTN